MRLAESLQRRRCLEAERVPCGVAEVGAREGTAVVIEAHEARVEGGVPQHREEAGRCGRRGAWRRFRIRSAG
jgi:hypothetical protein